MPQAVVVADKLDADEAERRLIEEIVTAAAGRGHDVLVVPDPYHVGDESGLWEELRKLSGQVTMWAWHHPRPLRWLLARHDVNAEEWHLLDLRTIELAHEAFADPPPSAPGTGNTRRLNEAISPRWYPVVDFDRCESCSHCRQFCLFGVYDQPGDGQVQVTQPDHCKPGCPACSRICPQGAIMFPLYDKDPAIAGAPGTRMSLDVAGRRMYYERTGDPCPTCAQLSDEELAHVARDNACPECGRKLPDTSPMLAENSPMLAEIDDLIARLDRLSDGGGQ